MRNHSDYKTNFGITPAQARYKLTAQELVASPVKVSLYTVPLLGQDRFLECWLGNGNGIRGRVGINDTPDAACVDNFYVAKLIRGKGVGSRLLQAFMQEAARAGATTLFSDEVSNDALRARHNLMAASHFHFYDCDMPELGELPLTLEQAMDSNTLVDDIIDASDDETFNIPCHFGVRIDLSDIGATSLNIPVEYFHPSQFNS